MKLDVSSDFAAAPRVGAPWGPGAGVGGVLFTTFALAVLTFVAGVCQNRGVMHAFMIGDDEDGNVNASGSAVDVKNSGDTDVMEGLEQELDQEQIVEEKEAGEQESVATCLSIADVSDETLQAVRKMLRRGRAPDVIQAEIYQAYGTQRVVTPSRIDQFSDMNV
ncbi:hypothetical protein BBO99_00007368 [Phytophthora kernoviae]|uniref:Uncharacterized protein n=2 Tax=Phytophthora kernoviae TaxID=325452 RepID=A0A421F454_9STRA|nr:hypothetical protein G195_008267 [Phytophthora kernoviae 00238/432]KAG2519248.1 hypothetical protein JM16_007237 [Phytophthora kernoviae]KAG2520352.1 hypothetical protein JM18_006866 [Phytophthora kernoviae]RLN21026.1 hypothetical protein BBI17_007323 [Phytophthora kernoviae]RLN76663.1 hypothetical protein BBO99_00007368 [Phytophthora kernoviae]